MKNLLLLASLLLLAGVGYSQNAKLTVYYAFANVEPGYDHDTKIQVFIDEQLVGESNVVPQTKGGSVTVEVPKGMHALRVMNQALYEGEWEDHTIDNNYSVDCYYEMTRSFNKPEKLYLRFDLDGETSYSWKKPLKKVKKKK
jgi:hypothetical protein